MEILQEIKVLNQPIICPWTSTAPLSSSKLIQMMEGKETEPTTSIEHTNSTNTDDKKTDLNILNDENNPVENGTTSNSSSQFFHFVRLMQLFPNVHPATLHTVMTLCKNDFFIAVDRLLYAKRCKELYYNRKNLCETTKSVNGSSHRYVPYSCNGICHQSQHPKSQIIKLDSKKMLSRNRAKFNNNYTADNSRPGCSTSNTMDVSQFTLQCNVPLRPLSPVTPEDLSSNSGVINCVNIMTNK